MYLSEQKSFSMPQLDINKIILKSQINIFKKRQNSSLFKGFNYYYPLYANINKNRYINKYNNVQNLYKRTVSEGSIVSIPLITKETIYNNNNDNNIIIDKSSSLNQPKRNKKIINDLSYYRNIFSENTLFKNKKYTFNNNLNLLYSDNEKNFENKMEINNKMRLMLKKPIKLNNRIKTTHDILNQIKEKIKFIKSVSEFYFPEIFIKKINTSFKKSKHYFIPPAEKKLNLIKIKNKIREKYLTDCMNINIYKNKNISKSFNN